MIKLNEKVLKLHLCKDTASSLSPVLKLTRPTIARRKEIPGDLTLDEFISLCNHWGEKPGQFFIDRNSGIDENIDYSGEDH